MALKSLLQEFSRRGRVFSGRQGWLMPCTWLVALSFLVLGLVVPLAISVGGAFREPPRWRTAQYGETLEEIARGARTSSAALASANPHLPREGVLMRRAQVRVPGEGLGARAGETAAQLAARLGLDTATLLAANPGLPREGPLSPQARVAVPGGVPAVPGESLAELAARLGLPPGMLCQLNPHLSSDGPLVPLVSVKLPARASLGPILDVFRPESPKWRWLLNSLALAGVVTGACFGLALPLAVVNARFEFRGKALLAGLSLVPMIMPPFVGAVGVQRLLARYGSLNLVLMDLGFTEAPIDFLGGGRFWAVAIMELLHLYPVMFLNLTAAISAIDPSLEESARNLGASPWRVFRTVTLPLSAPGAFAGGAIVFIWSFTDLGTPLIFGYQEVVAKQIFDELKRLDSDSTGFALVLVVLLVVAVFFAVGKRALKQVGSGQLQKGAPRAETRPLTGPLLIGAWLFFGGVFLLAVLPHLAVLLTAFAEVWNLTPLPESYTLAHFQSALTTDVTLGAIRNSLFYAFGSTLLDLILGVAIAYVAVRGRGIVGQGLDVLAMMPLAVPGILVAFGYVAAYGRWWTAENVAWFLILSYAVRRLPYLVRACVAGFEQTPVVLEEASRNLGAGPLSTLRRITLPLISAHLVAGAILCFCFAMLEVSDSLILAQWPQTFPLTKAIYEVSSRLSDGDSVACAMGVLAMVILTLALLSAASYLGKRLGEMFRV